PSERGIGQCGREEKFPIVRSQVVGRSLQNVIASGFACDAEAYRTGIAVDAQLRRLGIRRSGEPDRQKRGWDELFRNHRSDRLADEPFHCNGWLRGLEAFEVFAKKAGSSVEPAVCSKTLSGV